MRQVIFLDVDGVLNTHGPETEILRINASAFWWLVDALPRVEIVLSSAWRYSGWESESKFAEHLRRALDRIEADLIINSIIGATPPDLWVPSPPPLRSMECEKRSDTIRRYLASNPIDGNWIAIDDLEDIETLGEGHFIRTDPSVGFTMKNAYDALALLRRSAL